MLTRILPTIALLAASAVSWASEEYQDHASILETARQFVVTELSGRYAEEPEVSVDPLDPRLRLARCDQEIEAFLPAGGKLIGNTTVGVRCQGERNWSLYVSARITVHAEVLVAARTLARGTPFDATDVIFERKDLSRLPYGYLTDPAELEGMMATRRINSGTVLTPSALKEAPMVQRNEKVILVVDTGGLQIRAAGIAMESGTRGQRIRVRNVSSKRIVEGVIIGPGRVEISH